MWFFVKVVMVTPLILRTGKHKVWWDLKWPSANQLCLIEKWANEQDVQALTLQNELFDPQQPGHIVAKQQFQTVMHLNIYLQKFWQ